MKVIYPIDCFCSGCELNCKAKIFRIGGTKNSVKHQFPNDNYSKSICLNRPTQVKERTNSSKKVKNNNSNSKNVNNEDIEPNGANITKFTSSTTVTTSQNNNNNIAVSQ